MNTDRSPLFCSMALAERIERAEARIIARAGRALPRRRGDSLGFVIPVAVGVARDPEEGSALHILTKHLESLGSV
jgi:hypothetical protein